LVVRQLENAVKQLIKEKADMQENFNSSLNPLKKRLSRAKKENKVVLAEQSVLHAHITKGMDEVRCLSCFSI
jgi:hypothetical protein